MTKIALRLLLIALLILTGSEAHAQKIQGPAQEFDAWRREFSQKAIRAGVPADVVTREMATAALDSRIIDLDRKQPEFYRGPGSYVRSMASDARVKTGLVRLGEQHRVLQGPLRQAHVPAEIVAALWGVETAYGEILGGFDVVSALATLAFDGRRRDFAEAELIQALTLIARGQPRAQLRGSWAGAFGHTQFMPSSALKFGADGDRNGKIDLFTPADALASSAVYLHAHDWKSGQPWLAEVILPAGFDLRLADGRQAQVADWVRRGLRRADAKAWPRSWLSLRAAVLIPSGFKGPVFLTFENFEALKTYNASTSYALAVGVLANRLQGGADVLASWPDVQLRTEDIKAVQSALQRRGYLTSAPDGQFGPKTKDALRAFQAAAGLPADGFADEATRARLLSQP